VNAIAPGWFHTRMNDGFIGERGAEMVSRIPAGRFGQARDIGGLAAYLCSPAAAYLTGQVISMDGGMLLKL
jgi:gluconate 5-dehydrogenase